MPPHVNHLHAMPCHLPYVSTLLVLHPPHTHTVSHAASHTAFPFRVSPPPPLPQNCSSEKHRAISLECVIRLLRGPKYISSPAVSPPSFLPVFTDRRIGVGAEGNDGEGGDGEETKGDDGAAGAAAVPQPGRRRAVPPGKYVCVMGAFPGFEERLYRPEVFAWTTDALFGKKPLSNSEAYADSLVDIVLQMAVNCLQTKGGDALGGAESVMGTIRRLLDFGSTKAPEYVVLGLRIVRIMMTPGSKFMASAASTRCNKTPANVDHGMVVDFELVENELRMAAQSGIQQILGKCDDKVSLAVVGASPVTLPFLPLLDAPLGDEERPSLDHVGDTKMRCYLRVVMEGLRCLPFIGWRSGLGAFLERLYLVHAEKAIQTTAAFSLQRVMLNCTSVNS